jgi:hypothetical protein
MILNNELCDYVRLTTYNPLSYVQFSQAWANHIRSVGGKTEDWGFLQYAGQRTNHGFLGTGKQKGRMHYLTNYSGQPAHLAYLDLLDRPMPDLRCTRLDAQLTIALPANYDASALFDALNGNVPYGRKVILMRSDDGMDTVYIGKLTTKNGRVTRIYVKEHATGRALRFETQFNGTHAAQHWEHLRAGGTLASLLLNELESLGNVEISPLATFYAMLGHDMPAPRPTAVETSTPTLDWLINTVEPAILRMLRDHDHGWKVRHWLESLLDWS